jgi:hypothetical protein
MAHVSDQVTLAKHVDAAAHRVTAAKHRTARLETAISSRDALRAEGMFGSFPHASLLRLETAMIAAYYGIDYKRSTNALVAPFDYEPDPSDPAMPINLDAASKKSLVGDPDAARTFALFAMDYLYRIRRSPGMLTSLVNLPADAADLGDLVGLLQRYWNTRHDIMIREAAVSKYGVRNVSAMLYDSYVTCSRAARKDFVKRTEAQLLKRARESNPRVAAAARAILSHLRAQLRVRRPGLESGT